MSISRSKHAVRAHFLAARSHAEEPAANLSEKQNDGNVPGVVDDVEEVAVLESARVTKRWSERREVMGVVLWGRCEERRQCRARILCA